MICDRIILTAQPQNTWRKTCPSGTLSIWYQTWPLWWGDGDKMPKP